MKKKLIELISDLEDQADQYRKFVKRKREPGYELAPYVKNRLLFASRELDNVSKRLKQIVK